MNRRAAITAVALALVAPLVVPGGGTAGAQSGPEPARGSGSTFAEVALEQWAGDVFTFEGLEVDYSGIGSVGGLNQFQQGVVDFAATDLPYPEFSPITRPFAYVPIVAGGTALPYNLVDPAGVRITGLRLSPRTIAGIFFGEIDTWDAPPILAENPDLVGRLQGEIRRAVRTAGAGTTAVFTDYLSTVAPDLWTAFVARSQAVTQGGGNFATDWPANGNGFDCECSAYADSNGVANYIARDTPGSRGAIGYVESAYARQLALPVVAVRNVAGAYRLPTARNVAVALLEATENPDGTQHLDAVHQSARAEAYPISSYTYLVIPTADLATGKGNTLGRYLIYAVTEGQSKADRLGYSPLPPSLVQFALDRVGLINGAPAAPPLGDWGRFYESLEVDPPPPTGTGVLVAEYAEARFTRGGTELRVAPGQLDDDGTPSEELEIDLRVERCVDRSMVTTDVGLRTSARELDGVVLDARAGHAAVIGKYTLSGTRTTTPAGRRCARPSRALAVTEPVTVSLTVEVEWRNGRGSVPVIYGGADCGGDGACYSRDATARASWIAGEPGSGTARSRSAFFYEGVFPLGSTTGSAP